MSLSWQDASELTRKLKRDSSDSSVGEILLGGILVLLFIVLFGIPLMIYMVWANALAVKLLWGWFVVTTFGLEPLTWAQSWGLAIIIAYLTHVSVVWKAPDTRETPAKIGEIIALVLKPWFAIGIGYVCAHWFMHVV